jgi:hypothetical protein
MARTCSFLGKPAAYERRERSEDVFVEASVLVEIIDEQTDSGRGHLTHKWSISPNGVPNTTTARTSVPLSEQDPLDSDDYLKSSQQSKFAGLADAALLAVGRTAATLQHTPDTPTIYHWNGRIGPVSLTVDFTGFRTR